MRLWSVHPRYLDPAGLVACWREGLLARAVVSGSTVGYRNHPQLARFQSCADPVAAIDSYLSEILAEALRRGYRFDTSKIACPDRELRLQVTDGQLAYEFAHLKNKLKRRAPQQCAVLDNVTLVEPHPLFRVTPGEVENWEIIR